LAAGVDNGIAGGSDRKDRIQKLLSEAPESCTACTLATYPEREELGTWERHEWSAVLASLIDGEMVEHHEQADRSDSKYVVILLDAEGRSRKQRTFELRTRKNLTEPGMSALQLDGTNAASNALQQATLFKMVQLYATAMQSLLNSQTESIRMLTGLVSSSEEKAAAAREDYHELRELVAQLKEAQADGAGAAGNDELSPAQAKFLELATQAMPLLLARFGGGSS
jgi:hypothetical protein